jgi:HlyD family secretion protein
LFEQKRLALETAEAQLQEAQSNQNLRADSIQAQIRQAEATLNRIAEVRPVDVQAAQMDVNRAIAAVERSKAELNQAVVRSPIAGRILEIYAKPGEMVGNKGIADLGQTDQMQVVAEVYQSDISKVRLGQTATVTGESFDGELRGTVQEIGLQVSQQEILSQKPGENLDQRIVKVRIRLHPGDSQKVARLTNLQVQTAIQL